MDDFIGKVFGDKGQLTVVGWDGSRSGHNRAYSLFCSECAKDRELFGESVFKCTKGNLLRGAIPCGCSKGYRWDEKQYLLLADRNCRTVDRRVKNVVGDWRDRASIVNVSCDKCQKCSELLLANVLKGDIRKCSCQYRTPDEDIISTIMSHGRLHKDVVLWRSKTKPSNFEYNCPVCSNDEYVQAGVCSGIFSAPISNLTKGQLACRCSKRVMWTKDQQEYRINRSLDGKAHFVEWLQGYKGTTSKAVVNCPEHGEWKASTADIIDSGSGCPTCAKTGYSELLQGTLYVLKSSTSSKIGITNLSAKNRLSKISSQANDKFEVVKEWRWLDGAIAAKIEKEVLLELRGVYKNPDKKHHGYTECFTDLDSHLLVSLIEQKIGGENNVSRI